MTVKKLIELLKNYNLNAKVIYPNINNPGEFFYVEKVEVYETDKDTTPKVGFGSILSEKNKNKIKKQKIKKVIIL